MKIYTLGIDIAKNTYQLHGADLSLANSHFKPLPEAQIVRDSVCPNGNH
jgi:hypothetical protein